MAPLSSVMTVLGPVAPDELGLTLPHEHLFIDLLREYRSNGLLNDAELAIRELELFRAAGGRTIVDCTSVGLARDPLRLRQVSQATDVRIVMGSSHYRVPYIDRDRLDRLSTDEVADEIVRDLTEGADGTDIRAGIIGEVGCDRYLTAVEERVLRASARAHLQTGVTITTHAARWPVGLAQLDVLETEGVPPGRVIVGHSDTIPDTAYHLALAERGAFVQFDTIHGENEIETERRLRYVHALIDAGFDTRILLSHDICLTTDLRVRGGPGFTYIPTTFVELLVASGLDRAAVDSLLVDNPRRALTGEPG